jgi:hypothetical protein
MGLAGLIPAYAVFFAANYLSNPKDNLIGANISRVYIHSVY